MASIREMLVEAVKLHEANQLTAAENLYRQVLAIDPRQPDALNLLGVIANQVGRPELAVDLISHAIAVRPGEAQFHCNLAAAYKATGNVSDTITQYRIALYYKPDLVNAHVYLSDALMEQGAFEEALGHSLVALRLEPNSALAYCTLGEFVAQGWYTFTSEDIARMRALSESNPAIHDASIVYFTLAAYWEKQKDYDEAFRCYRRANDLKREVYRQANKAFVSSKHKELIESLIHVFTATFFTQRSYLGNPTEQPVFVIGMVRSGTSLVEQILASHPRAIGVGELTDIDQIARALPGKIGGGKPYPECLVDAQPAALGEMAEKYLFRLRRLGGGEALRVIDKMPHNYLHLGLIHILFPRARIIWCRRDTMDNCASTYFQNFKWLPYASSMEEIAFYYRQYERLMQHWLEVLPVAMHQVIYEDMIADQERVSRDLVHFCGLDWDERCLQFYKSARAVQTSSKLQVRQPIYTRSVARWKRFEAHLQPLRAALGLDTAAEAAAEPEPE